MTLDKEVIEIKDEDRLSLAGNIGEEPKASFSCDFMCSGSCSCSCGRCGNCSCGYANLAGLGEDGPYKW